MEMLVFTSLLEKMFVQVFLYCLPNIETNIKLRGTPAFIAASIVASLIVLKAEMEPNVLGAIVTFGPQHSQIFAPMQINGQ